MAARIARTRKQLSRFIRGGVTCITLIATAVTGQTNTGTRGTIDLNAGTLNGRPLGAWTLSEITQEFGRPSSVSPGISGITGPQLYYHPQGLEFWLRPIEKDSAQHVWILTVHLAREWYSDHSSRYSIFQGKLVPAVDANWNQSRLLKEFSSRTPVVETADEYNQKLKAGGFPSTLHGATTGAVHFDAGGTNVHFAIERSRSLLNDSHLRSPALRSDDTRRLLGPTAARWFRRASYDRRRAAQASLTALS